MSNEFFPFQIAWKTSNMILRRVHRQKRDSSSDHDEANNSGEIMEEFSVEEELLFARCLEEGYDLSDP